MLLKGEVEFKTIQIKDLGQVLTGNTPPTSKRELYGNRYPLIKAKDMVLGSRYIGATEESLSEKGRNAYQSKLLPRNATCVVTIGTLGKLCLTKEPCFCNQAINAIIPSEDYDNFYVFYLMRTVIEQLRLLDSGTASGRENVSKSAFSSIKLKVPPLPTQHKIAAILSAYDDLIENNNRRIEILEEMARMLYREWFVKFRYPGHESDRFYESELGLIPEGWEVGRLDDAIVLQRGFDLPKKKRKPENVPVYASTGIVDFHNEVKVKAPGVITGRSGSLGTVMYANDDYWPLNTTLWVKEFRKVTPLYAFYLLSGLGLDRYNSGAAVPTLNRNDVHGLPVVLPNKCILEKFSQYVDYLLVLKKNLLSKNNNLRQTRDLLLPRLISGEIDVENLDIKGVNN